MLGTYTVSLDTVVVWIMAGLMLAGFFWFLSWNEKRKSEKHAAEHKAREDKHKAREEKQLRDNQLNHGRRVYNWLAKELAPYQMYGIEVVKREDNGGGFQIEVIRRHEETTRGFDSLVQLTYDFVRYPAPYRGHIHYGSYGADCLIFVADYAPFTGLNHLIMREVRLDANRRKKAESTSA